MPALGTAFHDIVRQIHQPTKSQRHFYFLSFESCRRAWWGRQFWGKARSASALWTGDDPWSFYGSLGERAVKAYWEVEERAAGKPLAVEKHFGGTDCRVDGYHLRGVIDQARRMRNGQIAIVDLKLSRSDPNTQSWQLWLRQNIQLTAYWIAAQSLWSGSEVCLYVHHFWIHLEAGADDERHYRVTPGLYPTIRDDKDRERLREILDSVAGNIQDGLFPATENRATCRYCGYAYLCEQGQAERGKIPQSPVEGLEFAPELAEVNALQSPPGVPKQLRFKLR